MGRGWGNRFGELISTSCYTPWRLEIDEVKRQRVSVSNMISGGDSDGAEWLAASKGAIDSCFFAISGYSARLRYDDGRSLITLFSRPLTLTRFQCFHALQPVRTSCALLGLPGDPKTHRFMGSTLYLRGHNLLFCRVGGHG